MTILLVIIGILVYLGVGSLIMWGVGLLVCNVFAINYVWTIWHGIASLLIFSLLKGIFGGHQK